ncbi:MAG: HEAT repeat domain-containing protein [Bacilli bacterium]
MTEYKPGSSLGWFYKLKAESQKKAKVSEIENNILNKLSEMSVSDEAFFYICDILKPIASEDSIEIISKALRNEKRSASACDVLLGIDSSDVDEALEEALNQESITNRMNIISTLAARNNPDNVEIIAKQANSGNPVLGKFATVALGRTLSSKR